MRSIIVIIFILSAYPAAAHLSGELIATVTETGMVEIQADVYNGPFEPAPDTWNEIVIVCSVVGICEADEIISSDSWTLPEPGRTLFITWSGPIPRPHIHHKYILKARDEAGELQYVWEYSSNADIVAHGEAIATRGRFMGSAFVPCEEGCWDESIGCDIQALSIVDQFQLDLWSFSGQILNIYGIYHISDMLPNCWIEISRIDEHDGECGPIANRTTTWGDLKASYR